MAGSAASEAILFIAAIVAATAFAGIFVTVLNEAGDDVRAQGSRLSDGLRTDVVIINDPLAMTTSPLVVLAKNTGSVHLSASDVTVLLDGQPSGDVSLDVLGSSDDELWTQGSVLQITVNDLPVGVGDHRVTLITGTGIDALLEFNA